MQEIQMSRKTAAYKIHMDIMAAGEVAAEAFSTFCRLLKTMRDDKLWQELEYSSFEAYCENAVGIKKSQVYNYINVLENFGDEKVQSIGKLGIRKLQLIGSVPQELRDQFMDENKLQEMTTRQVEAAVKEYKDKLVQKEKELKQKEEWAEKQSKYADEHMQRARNAEFKLEKQETAIAALKADLMNAKNQLADAKAKGDTEKMKRLEETIVEQVEKLEAAQERIDELTRQLKDKPIEVQAAKVVEKAIIPDEVRNSIYNKVAGLYEGLLKLTQMEIQIFAQDVDPDYFDDVVQGLSDATGVLNNIDTAVFEAQKTQEAETAVTCERITAPCEDCEYCSWDGLKEADEAAGKVICTMYNEVVLNKNGCINFKER